MQLRKGCGTDFLRSVHYRAHIIYSPDTYQLQLLLLISIGEGGAASNARRAKKQRECLPIDATREQTMRAVTERDQKAQREQSCISEAGNMDGWMDGC